MRREDPKKPRGVVERYTAMLIACRSVANSKILNPADLANWVPPEHMRRRKVRMNPMHHERWAHAIDLGSCQLAGLWSFTIVSTAPDFLG